jgi:hypothetical protein
MKPQEGASAGVAADEGTFGSRRDGFSPDAGTICPIQEVGMIRNTP